ncbi:bleomycin resistance protein [Microbacterium sp. TNHR37B]|uniref:bleomycin resistance protein n=1 Tax=Microbacterium sp. TNHR37B TaxID=1775956 RepID=UPI0007B1E445|nr:bleomycin resistance protein [Microbacterium sp. TNHR37B]KZE89946.1 Bleomycin resistance protein [Microbacterium sp. TNHR37B]
MTDRAVPNLPSRDFDVTLAFYGGFGFELSCRSEEWLMLRRGELRLEFFAFPDLVPEDSSFMCSVRVDDLDVLYRQVAAAGVPEKTVGHPRLHPIQLQPWGRRAGFLIDPDGTQLCLIENVASGT